MEERGGQGGAARTSGRKDEVREWVVWEGMRYERDGRGAAGRGGRKRKAVVKGRRGEGKAGRGREGYE